MEPFATLTELKERLDWTLDAEEERAAEGYLEEASDLARAYGREWAVERAPRLVKSLVISAVRRFMRNPEGYTQSRAGDETLGWTDLGHDAGSIYYNEREQRLLAQLAGRQGTLISASTVAWGPVRKRDDNTGWVPTSDNSDAFPMFRDGYV